MKLGGQISENMVLEGKNSEREGFSWEIKSWFGRLTYYHNSISQVPRDGELVEWCRLAIALFKFFVSIISILLGKTLFYLANHGNLDGFYSFRFPRVIYGYVLLPSKIQVFVMVDP